MVSLISVWIRSTDTHLAGQIHESKSVVLAIVGLLASRASVPKLLTHRDTQKYSVQPFEILCGPENTAGFIRSTPSFRLYPDSD